MYRLAPLKKQFILAGSVFLRKMYRSGAETIKMYRSGVETVKMYRFELASTSFDSIPKKGV